MSDTEDADLEALRQAALSSLIKKKSSALQTNALFYRPTANSNLISIQPVQSDYEKDDENENDDAGSSSGSEYAVIEEGLSVSSADVDEVIEEVIVSEEESSEEGGEDAISIASHDSFDEILNSVEQELKGGKKRTASTSQPPDGPVKPKRSRQESEGRSKLARDRDRDQRPRNDRNYSPAGRQRRRSPPRPNLIPDRIRNRSRTPERRRSFENNGRRSPRNNSARRTNNNRPYSRSPNNYRKPRIKSPPQDSKRVKSVSPPSNKRDRSRSPTENRKPRSRSKSPITTTIVTNRKPISPPAPDNRRKPVTTGRSYARPNWTKEDGDKGLESNTRNASQRKQDSKSRDDRQTNNRRGLNNNNTKDHKSRSPERRNRPRDAGRKSPSPRAKRLEINFSSRRSKSKSPIRKMLSFGDSHLRGQEKRSDNSRRSVVTGLSGGRGRRSNSPKNGKANPTSTRVASKSPEVKSKVEKPTRKKSKSPPASPRLQQNLTEEEREKLEKRRLKFGSSVGKVSGKVVLKNSISPSNDNISKSREDRHRTTITADPEPNPKKSRIGARLGKVVRDDEDVPSSRRAYNDDTGSQNKPSRSPLPQRDDLASKDIDTEDLRTKLQQRRAAANVGRIFSAAMRDTLQKDSPERDRDRYARNRNKKSSARK